MPLPRQFINAIISLYCISLLAGLSACGGGGRGSGEELVVVKPSFQRISSFPVYLNSEYGHKTSAHTIAVSADGNTLAYTDRALESIGLVDISNPAQAASIAVIPVGGEPASIAFRHNQLLVAVDTSADFVTVSGKLLVIDPASRQPLASISLSGQPDAMALSADGRFGAVVIENRRDPSLVNTPLGQAPAGLLQVIRFAPELADWSSSEVNLSGLASVLGDDPEPASVAINANNIALVTLQKNNHLVLVDLADGSVQRHFSAGSVDLDRVDLTPDGVISMTQSQSGVLREPDGVRWLDNGRFASADFKGGHAGFSIFDTNGNVLFDAGADFSRHLARHGHFAERLAGVQRNQPHSLEYARYGDDEFLFIGAESAGAVLVYRLSADNGAEFVQLLPAGVSPDGLLAIPERQLLVAAASEDDRNDNIRSTLSFYQLQQGAVSYPTLVSTNDSSGQPIGFGALSGLTLDSLDSQIAYSVADAFYRSSRILELDISTFPAQIRRAILIRDSKGVLVAENVSLVNTDDQNSVNLDPEGITQAAAGGFWIASEGKGDWSGNPPFEYQNYLLRIAPDGVIEQLVSLPAQVVQRQRDAGIEGVASMMDGDVEMLYVAFQAEWDGDTDNFVRIGQYNTATAAWKFFNYELDRVDPAVGGKVGISDITVLANNQLMVLERDNRSGLQAGIKRLYKFSLNGVTPEADDGTNKVHFPELSKLLVDDLLDDLQASGGQVLEKIEGLAVTPSGTVLIINDNDGVERSNGETQLLRLNGLL